MVEPKSNGKLGSSALSQTGQEQVSLPEGQLPLPACSSLRRRRKGKVVSPDWPPGRHCGLGWELTWEIGHLHCQKSLDMAASP